MTETRSTSSSSERRPGGGRTTPALFFRQVIAELRKVIWPSRNQLVTYTLVVLVFVSFMVALVALLDFLVGQGVNALFGA